MKPISPVLPNSPQFPEVVYAKDQPEYLPLPACNIRYADGATSVVTRYGLSLSERFKLLFTGSLWLEQMTFGRPLQPQRPTLIEPLLEVPADQKSMAEDEPIVCADADEVEPIFCGVASEISSTETGEMMYMPGGLQTLTPIAGGLGEPITVLVNAAGASALNQQHAALVAKGKKPMYDFNHEDGPASFWPESYAWKETPEPGIYAKGEWTARGKSEVAGKEWRQFSPVFHVSKKRGATPQNPAHIVCREKAKPNMGGLVNNPAFHSILPLWAKDAGAASNAENQNQKIDMTPQELAALQSRIQSLEQQVALKAKDGAESDLRALQAELKLAQSELAADTTAKELTALHAKHKALEDADLVRRKAHGKKVAADMVARGAIAAKDADAIAAVETNVTNDAATFEPLYAKWGGNPALGGRITPGGSVTVVRNAPNESLKAYAALVAKNASLPLNNETHKEKGTLAKDAAAIFAKDIDRDPAIEGMSIDEALKAADYSDPAGSVGLLSGTLVLQRSLALLQYEYPLLSAITSDYSDAPGLLDQTEMTRIILKHAVQERSTAVDAAGRPVGWNTTSPAQSVDVPVKLTKHVGVPVVFGQNILASTIRNLFAEQAPMALYALGGYAVGMITDLFTAANYNSYKGTTAAAGVTVDGDNTIEVTSTANMYPGQAISGTGIPSNTYIASVTDATHAELTRAATASNTGLTFTLNDSKVPNLYPTYVKALVDFDVASMGDIKSAFDTNEVPQQGRFALLNSNYHTRLGNVPALNNFFAAMQKPEIVTEGALPRVQGFQPLNAPWFPSSSNRVGFAGHKAAAILKSRLPNDITSAVAGSVPGNVTTVTTPGGISVLLIQYVSLREGYAEWRPEVILGAAVGERRCGMVLTSQ